MKKPKRPRDTNELAKAIIDLATGEIFEKPEINSLADYASAFARKGGLAGGKARAKKLSKAQRVKIAKAGAIARWKKHDKKKQ
ncbi:MAG: histone H1 [Bacteroidota bacterium]